MNEQWRDAVGYEGYYQVSNMGRIRSVDRVVLHPQHGTMKLKGRILRPSSNNRQGLWLGIY